MKRVLVPSIFVTMLVAVGWLCLGTRERRMISEFGKYQGYSEETYNGARRTSDYLTLSDGTRLAYDLIVPTQGGVPADTPLPVLLSYTPYGRTWTLFDVDGRLLLGDFVDFNTKVMARIRYWIMGDEGRIMDPLFRDKWLGRMVKHGYIVVAVDRPGTGASFASPTPGNMETATKFLDEIIDWLAAQPWSDGNIGMYGESHLAMVQFAAAAAGNPHLKAILPAAGGIEIYQSVSYPGGIFNDAFNGIYELVPLLDQMATPVDDDPEGILLAQARESRKTTASVQRASEFLIQCPFRDSIAAQGFNPWQLMDHSPLIDRINQAQTPIYMTVGWYDIFTADMFYWYNNLTVPRRLTVRPTDHSQVSASLADLDYGLEAMRWLDYWLKGMDNGIMDEAPIHYYVQDGQRGGTWLTSNRWPPAAATPTAYYFGPGKTGTVTSVNDGGMGTAPPSVAFAADAYRIDYSTTMGPKSRWGAIDVAHSYPDLRTHDARAMTYTTPPLESAVVVTGHPVVHLWLATDAPDLDVFVYLEEIDSLGRSTYITEGALRASHRRLSQAPFDNLGLPYQSHYQSDQEPIPAGIPIELEFPLLPTSYEFHRGVRIRITIAFSDAGNFDTPVLNPSPVVYLLRDTGHHSFVDLPLVGDPWQTQSAGSASAE